MFSGLCSECKQKEIGELLACDSVAVQESWEREDSRMDINGLVSLILVKGVREWEGGIGFLVHECLESKVYQGNV